MKKMYYFSLSFSILSSTLFADESLFKKHGNSAEQAYDKSHKSRYFDQQNASQLGIVKLSTCTADNSDILNELICLSLNRKKKVGVGFKFICEANGGINSSAILSNQIVEWKTKLESSKSRTSPNGVLHVYSNFKSVTDTVTFTTKRFQRSVNLYKGPFEVLLSQKECGN
jgi:hypothetical protein